MNYIKRLQANIEKLEAELATQRLAWANLRAYVQSDKFTAEGELQGYVSTQDVLNRTGAY